MIGGTGEGARCAVLARAGDESLAGTAPTCAGWICLEQRGAWPHSVEQHPDPAITALVARAAAVDLRVLLIHKPGKLRHGPPLRVFLADSAPGTARVTTLTVETPVELADLDLRAPFPGTPVPHGLLLVCTHGRRDRCCAIDGRALTTAIAGAGEAEVWECSHLGGHRFAPTALVLPTGYLYGRLDAATAVAAGKAAGLGEVEPALCRGRSTWSPAGQVAELAVRAATGLRDAAALTVADGPGGAQLVTSADGRRWTVPVHETVAAAVPASCGAPMLPRASLTAGPVTPLTSGTPVG